MDLTLRMSRLYLLFLVCRFVLVSVSSSLTRDNRGKCFLVTFIQNHGLDTQHVLVVTSEYNATIYVDNPSASIGNQQLQYSVQSGGSLHIPLGQSVAVTTNQNPQKKAVVVLASKPIAIYAFSLEYRTSDGYLALPTEVLGTSYIMATFEGYNTRGGQVVVAAAENDTEVSVTLRFSEGTSTCGNTTFVSGQQLKFRLGAQDVVRVLCDKDISGSTVTSSRPVAVVSGNSCMQVPKERAYCDHAVEMMIPVTPTGTKYLLHTFMGRDSGAEYRIVKSQDRETVTYGDGGTPRNSGLLIDQLKLEQGQTMIVTSNKMVLAVGYALGQGSNNTEYKGDPFMTLLPSLLHAPSSYLLDLNITSGGRTFTSYVTAVVDSKYADGVIVGDKALRMVNVKGGYSVGSVTLSISPVRVYHKNSSVNLALVAYGFTDGEGFAFPAGMKLQDFSGKNECAPSPCKNGGICIEVGSSSRCHCIDVFGGPTCELDLVNECDSNPCASGATCTDLIRSFTCICPPQRTGYACDQVVPETTTKIVDTTQASPKPSTTFKNTIPLTTDSVAASRSELSSPASESFVKGTTSKYLQTTQSFLPTATSESPSTKASATTTEPLTTTRKPAVTTRQVSMTTKVVSEPPPSARCSCDCLQMQRAAEIQKQNATVAQQAEEKIKEIQEELTIDTKATVRARQRHVSARDSRVSATSIGIIGVSLLVLVVGFIIVMDITSLVTYIVSKVRSRQHKHKTSLETELPGMFGNEPHACELNGREFDDQLSPAEVTKFTETFGHIGVMDSQRPTMHRGSRRKHLLHVRPETILLHVPKSHFDRHHPTEKI